MERIHIIGKNPESIDNLKKELKDNNFTYCEENPEIVISYGGDGMFLIAERIFPSIPKLLIRDSAKGNNCHKINLKEALKYLNEGNFKIEEIKKIKATHKGRFEYRELIGINDIVIRNSLPTEAIRFRYKVNNSEWSDTLIGDGLVISTPYGSKRGAYFYSIEQKSFNEGLGIAFNNTTEKKGHLILKEEDIVEVEIMRGIGVLVSDNNRDFINLENGDKVKIRLIKDTAKRIILKEE
ncbi:MAG: hypothetical protein WC494_01610 [Candidatus Pacearchaeota archaeon]